MTPDVWPVESLFLVLTRSCNLRCTYCDNRPRPPARMERPTIEAAVQRLWAGGRRDVRLLFTGGEPLLEYPLLRQTIGFARSTRPPGRTVSFDLLTNGTLLREEHIAFLAKHRVSVQISLDGREPAQRLRGARTFARLDALVTRLRERHRAWFQHRVSAAVTLVPETVAHLADSIDYLLGRGFTELAVAPAMGDIHGWQEGLLPLLDDQFARVYRSSLEHYRRTGLVPVTLFREVSSSPQPPSSPLCGIANGNMAVVDVDGQVYGCSTVIGSALAASTGLLRTAANAMRIGHISDRGLPARLPGYRKALGATGLFGRRDGNRSSHGACRDCAYLRYCSVCPLSIALAPGAEDPTQVPDFMCAFNRVALKHRKRFPRQKNV